MAHKSKWRKICMIPKGATCYNCANCVTTTEEKEKVIVRCKLYGIDRILKFDRKISPIPYCGEYSLKKI